MAARKWLDSKMDSLVPFQVVIAVEALWALVALEWALIGRVGLWLGVSIHLLHLRSVTAIVAIHHIAMHAAHKRQLGIGVVDIG